MFDALASAHIPYETVVDSRDFIRIRVESKLKVYLVNDRAYRVGDSIRTAEGMVLDNILNMSANKICAVLGRDEPKDVFDLYTIFCTADPDWSAALTAAEKKCAFDLETLKYRLLSFPLDLVDLLPVPDRAFVAELKMDYRRMVERLIVGC